MRFMFLKALSPNSLLKILFIAFHTDYLTYRQQQQQQQTELDMVPGRDGLTSYNHSQVGVCLLL